jgi:hypothetical protein
MKKRCLKAFLLILFLFNFYVQTMDLSESDHLTSLLSSLKSIKYSGSIRNTESVTKCLKEFLQENNDTKISENTEYELNTLVKLYVPSTNEHNENLHKFTKLLPLEMQKKLLPNILQNRLPWEKVCENIPKDSSNLTERCTIPLKTAAIKKK